jgi:hypothetical protein
VHTCWGTPQGPGQTCHAATSTKELMASPNCCKAATQPQQTERPATTAGAPAALCAPTWGSMEAMPSVLCWAQPQRTRRAPMNWPCIACGQEAGKSLAGLVEGSQDLPHPEFTTINPQAPDAALWPWDSPSQIHRRRSTRSRARAHLYRRLRLLPVSERHKAVASGAPRGVVPHHASVHAAGQRRKRGVQLRIAHIYALGGW